MKLSLLTGRDAVGLAQSPAFQSKWKALYASCPWATACQHPDFVLPWYQLYQERFLPIIVLAESASGELQGLLTLARQAGSTAMTGAGERQAEYHAWLAAPATGDGFIRAALPALRAAFPGIALRMRYLPPGIPLAWTVERAGCARHCTLHAYRRPLMHADAAAMGVQRNKKNHRQNFNRLRRMGEVTFEKIGGHARFAAVFDAICAQYDFRQGVMHHQLPFQADPLKRPFYLELSKRGLLHTSLLTVDGEVAAAHVGLLSAGRAVHLGINTHAPMFAAHSPGNLLLAMLGVQLAGEAMPVLDLTPGGDEYKEHFATGHDLVFELTAYSGAGQRLGAEVLAGAARAVKTGLQAAGYRPARVRAAVLSLKQTTLARIRGAAGSLFPGPRMRELRCQVDAGACRTADTGVAKNCLDDAMKFDARGATQTYWQFLQVVMDRMEMSNDLYSLVRDGKLLVFCWMAIGGAAMVPQELQLLASQPGGAVLLFGLYMHPEMAKQEHLRSFLQQVLCDLQERQPGRQLHLQCRLSAELRQVCADSGFRDAAGTLHDGPAADPYQAPPLVGAEPDRLLESLHAWQPFKRGRSKETYVIALPGTPEEYAAHIGTATRASIQKRTACLRRDFPSFRSEFRVGDRIMEAELRELMRLSEARIDAGGFTLAHEAWRITALSRECGFVHVLLIDGRICAGSINYQLGQAFFGELIGYDIRYEKYGMGQLCMYQAICESIARGAKHFYLEGGALDYMPDLLARPLGTDALNRSRWKLLANPWHALRVLAHVGVRRGKRTLHLQRETDAG